MNPALLIAEAKYHARHGDWPVARDLDLSRRDTGTDVATDIDAVLADPMYSAEPVGDPIRDYSDRVDLFLNDRTALNVRKAVV